MKKRTGTILGVMNAIAWIAFFGLMIEAGSIIFNYVYSFFVEESPKNFLDGLNLYYIKQYNFMHYSLLVAFMFVIAVLEAYTAFQVTKVLSKIKLKTPFTIEVSKLLEKISYYILAIWIIAMALNIHINWLSDRFDGLKEHKISGDFLFLAGVVFVFAQIFKKGVEIQTENELTV